MKQCKNCYRTHEDTVALCDCGTHLALPVETGLYRFWRHYIGPRCPQCNDRLMRISHDNDGYGTISETLYCEPCDHLQSIDRFGLPYKPLMFTGAAFIVIALIYFAPELVLPAIVLLAKIAKLGSALLQLGDYVNEKFRG